MILHTLICIVKKHVTLDEIKVMTVCIDFSVAYPFLDVIVQPKKEMGFLGHARTEDTHTMMNCSFS